jgi:hypothetical protein
VPSSRNANPACIAKTMIAPSKINKTSLPDFKVSTEIPPMFFASLWGILRPNSGFNALI